MALWSVYFTSCDNANWKRFTLNKPTGMGTISERPKSKVWLIRGFEPTACRSVQHIPTLHVKHHEYYFHNVSVMLMYKCIIAEAKKTWTQWKSMYGEADISVSVAGDFVSLLHKGYFFPFHENSLKT